MSYVCTRIYFLVYHVILGILIQFCFQFRTCVTALEEALNEQPPRMLLVCNVSLCLC